MSVEDYNLFLQDTKDKKALLTLNKFLEQENKELKMVYRVQVDSLQREIDQLNRYVTKLESQAEAYKNEADNANKRAEGYKELAKKKSLEALKMQKWRGRYYEVASIKVVGIIIPIGLFIGGIFLIMGAVNGH